MAPAGSRGVEFAAKILQSPAVWWRRLHGNVPSGRDDPEREL